MLLLELREHEVNPTSRVPTYIAISNRDMDDSTKEIKKSGGIYMLVDPPTSADMQIMALMEKKLSATSIFEGVSEENIKQTIGERMNIVGPKLREIFVSQDEFDEIKENLIEKVSAVFSKLDQVSVSNMPKGAKNYLGAFVVPGTFIPSLTRKVPNRPKQWRSVKFLSDFIARIVAQSCSEENKSKLVKEKFDYLIAEAIMCYALTVQKESDFMDDKWLYKNWVFYKNFGGKNKLNKDDQVDGPAFPLCEREEHFASMYLDCSVSTLKARTLYRCSIHGGALYDAMLVCHPTADGKRGIVYAFQSSCKRANQHTFDYFTVKTVMDKLQFAENLNYDMCSVYCSDESSNSETGCTSSNTKNVSEEDRKFVDERLIIKIARVCYYPEPIRVIL